MKRYELKSTQSQPEILLHSSKRYSNDNIWSIQLEMSCEGYAFNLCIDSDKFIIDFLEKENKQFDGCTKEIISYIKYIFE